MSVSILPFDPNPDGTCRACRGALAPDTLLCQRCGAAHGERNRCPHCHSIARTLPHPTLLHRCSVCGRPRFVPGPNSLSATNDAVIQLRAAGQSHRVGVILQVASGLLLALEVMVLLVVAGVLFVSPNAWVSGIALALALVPLLFWLFVRSRGKAALGSRDQALERAYAEAILGTLNASAVELDTESIARQTGLSTLRTEKLLTQLNADDRMTSRVTDDGALLFGTANPLRLRVADLDAVRGVPESASPAIIDAELDEPSAPDSHARHQT
jgi:hypothetical protein